jgi:hypothetical protein
MRKTKSKSKSKRDGRAPSTPRTTSRSAFPTVVGAILRAGRGLAGTTDPLDAEIFASLVVSMLETDPNARPEQRLALVDRLLETLPKRRSPDVLAITLALAAVLPDPWATRAQTAAARIEANGLTAPVWKDSVGRARFVEGWAATDEFGDQDLIVASFQHPGYQPHAISLTADHNFGGLFRQGAVGVDPDAVRAAWADVSPIPLRPMTARDLAGRWADGVGMYRLYLDPPVYDDVPPAMALLEARASALPEPPEPKEPAELTEDDRRALLDAFLASRFAAALSQTHAVFADLVADHIIDFRAGHGEGDLLRWSPIVVEIAMLDWLPRKALLNVAEIDALPDVLRAFVRFAAEQRSLADSDLDEILTAIAEFEPEFRSAAADPVEFGWGKRLAQQMQRDGVDMTDERATQDWIEAFNALSVAERDEILGPM